MITKKELAEKLGMNEKQIQRAFNSSDISKETKTRILAFYLDELKKETKRTQRIMRKIS
jgi:hypothetical protein